MNEQPERTVDWPPAGCPEPVIKLITDDQRLQDMGLRGLVSSDATVFSQAVAELEARLAGARAAGEAIGMDNAPSPPAIGFVAGYLVVGFIAGALSGALLVAVFGG